MKKLNKKFRYIITSIFLVIFFNKLINQFDKKEVLDDLKIQIFEEIQLIKSNSNVKVFEQFKAINNNYLNSINTFFDQDPHNEQLELYLKQKNSSTLIDDYKFSKFKKILEKSANKPEKDQYLIVEYTPVFDQSKYCHLNIDDDLKKILKIKFCLIISLTVKIQIQNLNTIISINVIIKIVFSVVIRI